MAPTIRDVAQKAKVAPSTVSAVINGKGYIHEKTKARVLEVIRQMDYIPQRSARSLSTQKSGNIGFVISAQHFTRSEPFYTRVFLGTEFEAQHHDVYILFSTAPDQYKGRKDLPRFAHERNVDGVIIAGSVSDELIHALEKDMPVVLVDYALPDTDLPQVLIDNERGSELAVHHLFENGFEKLGFISGDMGHPSEVERHRGFINALNQLGVAVNPEWIIRREGMTDQAMGMEMMKLMMKMDDRPDGLVCFNDAIALGALRAAEQLHLKVPDDIAVVGFDDVDDASFSDPPLTTIRVFKEDLGTHAVKMLVDMINQPDKRRVTTRVSVELVVRESSQPVSTGKAIQ